jgi:hypothetical protein
MAATVAGSWGGGGEHGGIGGLSGVDIPEGSQAGEELGSQVEMDCPCLAALLSFLFGNEGSSWEVYILTLGPQSARHSFGPNLRRKKFR